MNIAIARNMVDVVVLQEVWHPLNDFIFKGFSKPIMKLRQNREGGGVAIAVSKETKMVHCKQYDIEGLEAIWADIIVDNIRTIIGSFYINVGKIKELDFIRKGCRAN